MKKVIRFLTLGSLMLTFSIAPISASDIGKDEENGVSYEKNSEAYFYDEYSDEHIIEILTLYHNETCGMNEVTITTEDVKEFKMYYVEYSGINQRKSLAAFPTNFSHYYNGSTGWLYRTEGISLSIDYKPSAMYVGGNNPNAQAANAANAFTVLKNKYGSDVRWKNTASMEAQFHCHVVTIGKLKNPWNIEPWRTQSDLIKVILDRCNP